MRTLWLGLLLLAQEPSADLAKKEAAALASVGDELLKLARVCATNMAYTEARAELEFAMAVAPSDKLKAEIKRIADRKDTAKPAFAAKLADERKKTYQKCADLVGDVALACEKAGEAARYEKHLWLIQNRFPSQKTFDRLGVAWFEPYLKWMRKADAAKLEAGGECVDGKWLTKAEVAALDGKHATWDDPWAVSDEVHEVRTKMPLRMANRVLAHARAYREFFLGYFAGIWDLKAPDGKLPIIVTETQDELRARMKEAGGGDIPGEMNGAAYYLQSAEKLNPCFVTFEPTFADGKTVKVDFKDVVYQVRHELSHQIAFEYSKHDFDATRHIKHHFWSVEGVAQFMMFHVPEKGAWRLTRPRVIPVGEGFVEGAFSWCLDHLNQLPALEEWLAIPREKWLTVENYHIAGTFAYFLLEGEERKYRGSFVKLLEAVHKVKEEEESWKECLGVEPKALEAEWKRFVGRLKIE